MEPTRRLALRVGFFAAIAVVTGFLAVVVLGGEQLLIRSQVSYRVYFPDVSGLLEGAFVRVGGRNVGIVTGISFNREQTDRSRALVVSFRIRRSYARLVREDSRVQISTQGLLGDKLIDVSIGSPAAPAIPPGGTLVGEPPTDTNRLITVATDAATHARDVLARIDEATKGLSDEGTLADLRATAASVRAIVARVERGPGLAHALLYDEQLAANAAGAVESGRVAVGRVGAAAGQVARVFSVINTSVPAEDLLVYTARAAKALAEASEEISPAAVRRVSQNLVAVTDQVASGRGTIGGLIMDPTLYEESKQLVVGVRRNRVLRALARWAIARSGSRVPEAGPGGIQIQTSPGAGPIAGQPAFTPRHAPTTNRAPRTGENGVAGAGVNGAPAGQHGAPPGTGAARPRIRQQARQPAPPASPEVPRRRAE